VGKDFLPAIAPKSPLSGRAMGVLLRDDGILPPIRPTCQNVFAGFAQSIHASDHHATLHGVVFDILVGSEHRVGLAAVSAGISCLMMSSLRLLPIEWTIRTRRSCFAGADNRKACHQIGETAKNGVGPVLNGVIGRTAGSVAGYSYSDANKNSGITWDEATFREYIKDPKAKVPGTKMIYPGLKDEQKTNDLVAFFKQFDADGKKR
jgi:cytochrome c